MFMIAYDPETDFTVQPWLERNMRRDLRLGEAVGGCYVSIPEGRDNILIYGYEIELVGMLERTGSGLDQSMFFRDNSLIHFQPLWGQCKCKYRELIE